MVSLDKPFSLRLMDQLKKNTLYVRAGNEDQYSCEFGSMKYYALCGFGGILSCGLTHTAVVPLDLVKCRIQVFKIQQMARVRYY